MFPSECKCQVKIAGGARGLFRGPCGARRTLTRTLAILAAPQRAAVVKLVYTQASGACGLYARGGSSPLSRTLGAHCYSGPRGSLPLSSRGLGRRPLTAETGVRIPVAVLREPACPAGFVVLGRVRPRQCIRKPADPQGSAGASAAVGRPGYQPGHVRHHRMDLVRSRPGPRAGDRRHDDGDDGVPWPGRLGHLDPGRRRTRPPAPGDHRPRRRGAADVRAHAGRRGRARLQRRGLQLRRAAASSFAVPGRCSPPRATPRSCCAATCAGAKGSRSA